MARNTSLFQITRDHVHQSNLIEGFDDPKIDQESFEAWRWLHTLDSKRNQIVDHAIIMRLQARLTAHQTTLPWRGAYRNRGRISVSVGGRNCLPPMEVPAAMDKWLEDYNNPETDPQQSHIEFEKIHPFVDGNGRTGRMLMWDKEIKNGIAPTLITKEKVDEYYKWFV